MANETNNGCKGLKVLDPVQGLVDYVNDVKPYHTKIIEVLIEYVFGEAVAVTIYEKSQMDVGLFLRGRDISSRAEACADGGFGVVPWGGSVFTPVVAPNGSLSFDNTTLPAMTANTFIVPGDMTREFRAGVSVDFLDRIEQIVPVGSPVPLPVLGPNIGTYTILSAEYNAGSIDRWPGFPDIETYVLGNYPHTVVTLTDNFVGATGSPLDPIPTVGPNEIYVAEVRLSQIDIVKSFAYSNVDGRYDPSVPEYLQRPNEGTIKRNIVDLVVAPTNEVTIPGDFSDSNVFAGMRLRITNSTANDGIYTISTISYDQPSDRTTFGVLENIVDTNVDGQAVISIPSNMFVVNTDLRSRFRQGSTFTVVSGPNAGVYTTLYSTYSAGQTFIRVAEPIFETTSIGVIKERNFYGFSEAPDLCSTTPETLVRVKMFEKLKIDTYLEVGDDVVVFNLENNDPVGYELPIQTIISASEPYVYETTSPPGLPSLNALWYATDPLDLPTPYVANTLYRWTGTEWEQIQTAYWLNENTNILYYRKWNAFVDTGWLPFFEAPPGYNGIQSAKGQTVLVGHQTFNVDNIGFGAPQEIFEFDSLVIPGADPTLLKVKVNGIPAEFIVNNESSFTILSPRSVNDVVVAEIYQRTTIIDQLSADVGVNADARVYDWEPHTVFHRGVEYDSHGIGRYIIPGGNYIHRFIEENSFGVYNFSGGGGLLATQNAASWTVASASVVSTSPALSEIVIDGNHVWLFGGGTGSPPESRVITIRRANNILHDFKVVSATAAGSPLQTTITVQGVVDTTSPINDLGELIGAVYDWENAVTIVAPSTPAESTVEGITYTWLGPARITNSTQVAFQENVGFGWDTTYTWPIVGIDQGTDTIFIEGDLSGALFNGDVSKIVSSQGNNGTYTVVSATQAGSPSQTAIVVAPSLSVDAVSGYFKVENVDIVEYFSYDIQSVVVGTNTITVDGNAVSDIQIGQKIRVTEPGSPLVEHIWTVSTFLLYQSGTNTTVFNVSESVVTPFAGGTVEAYRYRA